MNIGHNWQASFIDESQRVMLTKPGNKTARNICMEYEFPFLRRIDARTGMRMIDHFNVLPPDCQNTLLEACKERWGGK